MSRLPYCPLWDLLSPSRPSYRAAFVLTGVPGLTALSSISIVVVSTYLPYRTCSARRDATLPALLLPACLHRSPPPTSLPRLRLIVTAIPPPPTTSGAAFPPRPFFSLFLLLLPSPPDFFCRPFAIELAHLQTTQWLRRIAAEAILPSPGIPSIFPWPPPRVRSLVATTALPSPEPTSLLVSLRRPFTLALGVRRPDLPTRRAARMPPIRTMRRRWLAPDRAA